MLNRCDFRCVLKVENVQDRCRSTGRLCKGCEWLDGVCYRGPVMAPVLLQEDTMQPTPYARPGLTRTPDSSGR